MLAPSIAFAGAGDALPDAWQYVERFTGVHGEAPWYLGLRAYGRTEQGLWYDAADLADAALELDPGNGNAAHALTHVHYETDAHGAGLKWLTDWIPSDGSTQRYLPHFQWHAALHELAMGDAAAAARRYNASLAPPHSKGVRCLVDAGSLAWRARLHPDWVTPPDPMRVLDEVGSLAFRRRHRSSRSTRCWCWPRRMIRPRSARSMFRVPPMRKLTTLRLIGEGLDRVDGGGAARRARLSARIARRACLDRRQSRATRGGSRNGVGRNAPTRCAGPGGAPAVAASRRARAAGDPRRRELTWRARDH